MSFLDKITNTIGNFGGALASKVGLVKDIAMSGMDVPGPRLLPDDITNQVRKAAAVTAHAPLDIWHKAVEYDDKLYRARIAFPIVQLDEAARIARRDTLASGHGAGSLDEWQRFFSGDVWDQATQQAHQEVYSSDPNKRKSLGQSLTELAMTGGNQTDRAQMSSQEFHDTYSDDVGFHLASGALDATARWYLDPAVLVGKAAAPLRLAARLKPIPHGTDLQEEIGSASKIGNRWSTVKEGIRGKSSFQIWTSVEGLRDSRNGPALASALYKADRVKEPVERDRQLNLIGQIIYGDEAAKLELSAEHAEIADQIGASQRYRNHLMESVSQESNPQLTLFAQDGSSYWMEAKPISYFGQADIEAEHAERLGNLDDAGKMLEAESERLQSILDLHGAATGNQLRVTRASARRGLRAQGVTGPKAVVRDLSEKPAWFEQSVIHKSLWNIPVQVLKLPARAADSLTSMRGHGMVNLHDPDGVDELSALLNRPYFRDLDTGTRNTLMSNFINAGSEDAQIAAINDIEKHAFAHLSAKHGLKPEVGARVFNEYAQQKRTLNGRIRMYGGLKARQSYSEAPHPTDPNLTADAYLAEDGTVIRAPFLSTHLANNVPLLDADLVNHVLKRQSSTANAMADWLQDYHTSMGMFATSQALRYADGFAHGLGEVGLDLVNGFQRLWKWAQLTRVGYPFRNLLDTQARANAELGSAMVQQNIESLWYGIMNRGDDLFDRRAKIAIAAHRRDQDNLHELEDMLSNPLLNDTARGTLEAAKEPIQRRLEAAQGGMKAWEVYKPPRHSVGVKEIETPWGNIDAPFKDSQDDLNRILSSSHGMTAHLISEGSARSMSRITSSGDWVRIEPHDPDFRAAWLHAVNKVIRQDPVASKVVAGWSDNAIVDWLQYDADGQKVSKRLKWNAANKEEWVKKARSHVDSIIPPELRDSARKGDLTGGDLDNWVNSGGKPAAINGPALDYALGKGPAANAANRVMNTTAKFLGDMPETKFGRHPFFVAVYRKRAKDEAARIMADPHRAASGKSMTHLDQEDLARIKATASRAGMREIRRIMYDHAAHSNAATQLRFISPFMGAWEDTLRRWWTISTDKPQVLGYFKMAFEAPKHAGLIVDGNGEVVDEGHDPEGPTYLQLALPAWAGKHAVKIGGKVVSIPLSSFNVWMQSNPWFTPGFGPIVQVPVAEIVKHKPSLEPLTKSVLPFGPPADLADALLPATGRRLRSEFGGLSDRKFAGDYGYLMQDAMYEADRDGKPLPTPDQIIRETQGLFWVKALNNVANPFPAQFSSPYQFMRDGYRNLLQQAEGQNRPNAEQWATDQFVKQYGHEALYLIGSLSQNNANIMATAEGTEAFKKYRKDIGDVPEFSRQIVGREDEGAYSSAAYQFQLDNTYAPGSTKRQREFKDPAESIRNTNVNVGWFDYNKELSSLDSVAIANGLRSWRDSPVLSQMRRDWIAQMADYNPDWTSAFGESSHPSTFEVTWDKLQKLDWAGMAKKSPMRTDFTVMQDYIAQRKVYADLLSQREHAGVRGQENNDIKAAWSTWVLQLAHDNSLFADNWFNGTLEFDPLLLDTSEEE